MTEGAIRTSPGQEDDANAAASTGPGGYAFPRLGIVALAAAGALMVAAWHGRHRRRGARIAADEARMEPDPVVY